MLLGLVNSIDDESEESLKRLKRMGIIDEAISLRSSR